MLNLYLNVSEYFQNWIEPVLSLKIADLIESLSKILSYKSDLLRIFGTKQITLNLDGSVEMSDQLGDLYQSTKDIGPRKLNSKRNKQGMFYSPNNVVQFMIASTLKHQTNSILHYLEKELINDDTGNSNPSIYIYSQPSSVVGQIFEPDSNIRLKRPRTQSKKTKMSCSNLFDRIHQITVLDPACGSGVFLISAIRHLISFYRELENKIEINSNQTDMKSEYNDYLIPQNPIKRYEQIITRHVFGVDIDPISIDITKINVFLELLRFIFFSGETIDFNKMKNIAEEVSHWSFFKSNLKIGNALLSFPVFEESKIIASKRNGKFSVNEVEHLMSNRFADWLKNKNISLASDHFFSWVSAFPTLLLENTNKRNKKHNLGFSCIIGNPPWGASLGVNKTYVSERFQYKIDNINSFELFILLGLELLKGDGLLSFIIPRNFLKTNDYIHLREMVLRNYQIELIADIGCSFKQVAQESIILCIKKSKSKDHKISLINNFDRYLRNQKEDEIKRVLQSEFFKIPDYIINPNFEEHIEEILKKIESRNDIARLGDLVNHGRGIEYGKNGAVILCPVCQQYCDPPTKKNSEKNCPFCNTPIPNSAERYQIISDKQDEKHTHPIFVGKHLSRYSLQKPYYLDTKAPGIRYKDAETFAKNKILLMKISISIKATLDYSGAYITQALYFLIQKTEQPTLEHILGILNSKLMEFYYEHRFNVGASITTNVTLANILRLPIIRNNNSQLEAFVKDIISGKKNLDNIEDAINKLVFDMYGLSENEIEIIQHQSSLSKNRSICLGPKKK